MTERFDIQTGPIDGLRILQRKPIGDTRGYLERMFCAESLQELMGNRQLRQINHTLTAGRGTVRGMHYQLPPHTETKFVSCLQGTIFDVAVDLRRGSNTFLQWHAEILSGDNHITFVIPEGFAHGFQTLTDNCHMLYLHTAAYVPESEAGVSYADPRIGIDWPEGITELSERDAAHPHLTDDFEGISP